MGSSSSFFFLPLFRKGITFETSCLLLKRGQPIKTTENGSLNGKDRVASPERVPIQLKPEVMV